MNWQAFFIAVLAMGNFALFFILLANWACYSASKYVDKRWRNWIIVGYLFMALEVCAWIGLATK